VLCVSLQQVPEGLEAAVMKMEKGQRSIITITHPALAYGSKGYTGTSGTPVPPDTPVTFDLTLNSFDAIKEKWSMDNNEKVRAL
jgi:FKBP-type peptidyl-prolyl cis-trans isomerase